MAFKMRSGNTTSFKSMGSSPMNKRTVTKTTDAEGNTTKTVTKTGILNRHNRRLEDAEGNPVDKKDFKRVVKTKTKDASGKRTSKSVSRPVSTQWRRAEAGTKDKIGWDYDEDGKLDETRGSTRTVKGRGLKAEVTDRSGKTMTRGKRILKTAQNIANIPGDILRNTRSEVERLIQEGKKKK
jgi:hypothetical protein